MNYTDTDVKLIKNRINLRNSLENKLMKIFLPSDFCHRNLLVAYVLTIYLPALSLRVYCHVFQAASKPAKINFKCLNRI